MKLWQARCEFSSSISLLVIWASRNASMAGFEVAYGEGLVAVTDARDGDHDGPHKAGGAHYNGLGVDLLIYDSVRSVFVADGAHPAYRHLGEAWRQMHGLARWGGDFSTPDPDHFSFAWGGVA